MGRVLAWWDNHADRLIRSGVTWGLVALLGFLVGFVLPWVMYRP